MSLFGKNIRKIRTVRSLSQQSFAELFNLKRGTLGAYEEGRSEPKIDTIITIANYFSIPIGDLLTKELTVNQLLKFRGELGNPDSIEKTDLFTKVPCITPQQQSDYISHCGNSNYINDMPFLNLPIQNSADLRAFIIDDLEMSCDSDGFYPKDVVFGEKVSINKISEVQNSCLFITVSNKKILLRRLFASSNKFILKADHRGIEDVELKHSEIKELWEVKYVFYNRVPEWRNSDFKQKLSFLENEFEKLRSSLNK